ncbi:MAG: glycosyltransferase family 2 protein [Candidatus Scalindua sp.]|jgi:glycosyltransferase involved in cell wall biosynthesis|nr:glycosyltransferase family 2 protein [Candidatus Scalindua sp.]MBT6230606.1 glycosyltransferase family 2 protein [Candidatus Scalindua sp.]
MISFVFPIYKQEHVLERSISILHEFLEEKYHESYEIIICNDGSPDNCSKIAHDLSRKHNNVRVIGYEQNRGRGHALKYSGLHVRGDYLICMDCDLIKDDYIEYIEIMIAKLKQYDVVIASRFLQESGSKRKWKRKVISKCYRILVKILFPGFYVTDPDVGFKGFKKQCFNYTNLMTNLNGPSWDLQFLVNASMSGYEIHEFPFRYIEDYENSTVNLFFTSFIEFLGMLYIRVTTTISKKIVF